MQIDYFLDKRFINKMDKENIQSVLFQSLNCKINFDPKKSIQQDIYLTNFMKAYEIKKFDLTYNDIFARNIIALLYAENEIQDLSYSEVIKTIFSINNGMKTKTKLEKLILNVIEINRLINKIDFKINEENYELIIHLLFRNRELNLDRKINYYRSGKNTLGLTIDIDPKDIELEMQTIFKYMLQKPEDSFDGITKLIIIFYSLLIVEPHQKFNIILSFILTNWYVRQNNISSLRNLDLFTIFNNWDFIVKIINNSLKDKLNFDEVLLKSKQIIKHGFKTNYLNELFEQWNEENKVLNKWDVEAKFILLKIIGNEEQSVSKEAIIKAHLFKNNLISKNIEIEKNIENLINLKLIKSDKNKTHFELIVEELSKFKEIIR
ncbi:hypothetical protein EELLY_v1c04030 [Entomoplasma ellychniae]|uniref:Fido domain-containing protein n=1 Tax=Entomoplasma ellychniae TaxID=2114 RepID=A0A8E2QXJ0_9MOLU|nr:hypothetical protein [Entomoplasma ellychniae]PPE04723.1 hypothetical protein EELLY_v1c04030 [Entomoplasma ellychniae]